MAFCNVCQIEVGSSKFCTTCGSMLQNSKEESAPNSGSAQGLGKTEGKRAKWVHLTPLILIALSPVSAGITLLFLWLPARIIRRNSDLSSLENRHAKSALNFHLSIFLYFFLGFFLLAALLILVVFLRVNEAAGPWVVLVIGLPLIALSGISIRSFIKGAVAGSRGEEFSYPLAIPFLK